jgi:putative glutamine amidotransferase
MPAPLIGITTHPPSAPDHDGLDALLAMIVAGIERAGGLPVLIPSALSDTAALGLLERLDGLLLSGGGDIDPACYGAAPHPTLGGVSPERDRVELALARRAVADARPLFGICRGAQLLNVALGGTLYADLGERPGTKQHTFYPGHPYDLRPHAVEVARDSLLARAVGNGTLTVNSMHHQACREVAPALRVTACSPDGVVEALELPGHSFALAVQWHPEALPDAPEMRRLFESFIAASAPRGRA